MSKRLIMVVVVAASLLAMPAIASAAPIFGVTITPTPRPVPVYGAVPVAHGDQVYDYALDFTNSGTPVVGANIGDVVKCTTGFFNNNPTTYDYQWLLNGADIVGANGAAYTVAAGDAGKSLQCRVRAANAVGTSLSVSTPVFVEPLSGTAPATQPTSMSTPSGAFNAAGAVITCPNGTWGGSPTSYTYQWYRSGVSLGSANGAQTSTYTAQAADLPGLLQCVVTATNASGIPVSMAHLVKPSTSPNAHPTGYPAPNGSMANRPKAAPIGASITVTLPPGVRVARENPNIIPISGSGWTNADVCDTSVPGKVTCTRSDQPASGEAYPQLTIKVSLVGSLADDLTATATVSGSGGATPATVENTFALAPARQFGMYDFMTEVLDANGDEETRAGAHPYSATTAFKVNGYIDGQGQWVPVEDPKTISVDLPPGFVGNPQNAPKCKSYQADVGACPIESQVGVATVDVITSGPGTTGVYNIEPRKGHPAEFAFNAASLGIVHLYPRVRSDGDYGLTVDTPYTTQARLKSASFTFWGVPADPSHDAQRCVPGNVQCFAKGASSTAPLRPFLSNLTECNAEAPVTTLRADSWQTPGTFKSYEAASPLMTGCLDLEFDPTLEVEPASTEPASPTGYSFHLGVPQTNEPGTLATPPLKDATVTLPEGALLSPGTADGLQGCTDTQLGLHSEDPATCPLASKIGQVHVATPVLPEAATDYVPAGTSTHYQLTGDIFLRQPDPGAHRDGLYSIFLDIEDDQTGVTVKLRGNVVPDAETGQLTAKFTDNPRLPFTDFLLEFKGGSRAPLANPVVCGTKTTTSTLTSWGGPTATPSSGFEAGAGCASSRDALPFAPSLTAGTVNPVAGGSSPFAMTVGRGDVSQNVRNVEITLPKGLLANVSGVSLCSTGQADDGTCGDGSKIGTTTVALGSGPTPLNVPQAGKAPTKVFLSGPYKGAPYSLSILVPNQAGPFDLGRVVARVALDVDPTDAHVTARLVQSRVYNTDGSLSHVVDGGLPQMLEGIALNFQKINVALDRPGFILNPTSCAQKSIRGLLGSPEGKTADLSTRFQVSDCASLPFAPKIGLQLTGPRQVTTGKHPGVKAVVTQKGVGEAGIDKAVVRLPKSLALDPDNAQALCEYEDGIKPDIENHCPKGSIVGRARAKTPLLKNDLVGNVYFVKNVRKDPKTGNLIRTLPMLVVALRGEISVNLKGDSSTAADGRLINTFASIPDAPISRFNLNIKGGKTGILAVTRTRKAKINLCASRQTAEADTDGQNGRRHDFNIRIKTPCTKAQVKRAKRAAAKVAKG